MIKELEWIKYKEYVHLEDDFGHEIKRLPNNREIMDKINEIIRYINTKEE